MFRILLLGSSGYIGSHILNILKDEPSFTILSPSSKELDLKSKISISTFFFHHVYIDIVLYSVIDKKNKSIDSNICMLQNLLLHKNKFNQLVYLSSRSVYDSFGNYHLINPISPLSIPTENMSLYGQLKIQEERFLVAQFPKCIILRLFDTFSDDFINDSTLKRWMYAYKLNLQIPNELLSPIHVEDAAYIIKEIIKLPIACGSILNICGSEHVLSSNILSQTLDFQNLKFTRFKEKTGLAFLPNNFNCRSWKQCFESFIFKSKFGNDFSNRTS